MNKKQELEKIINDSDNDNTSNIKRVSEQSNSSRKKSLKPYIKRLPKLFRITGDVLDDIRYLNKTILQLIN